MTSTDTPLGKDFLGDVKLGPLSARHVLFEDGVGGRGRRNRGNSQANLMLIRRPAQVCHIAFYRVSPRIPFPPTR
jgi:hypothetical protein